MKMIRMQSVGQSVEECPSGAYCYNMTASAALIVDVVKAGCSTWRCMLARDKCISLTIQMVPVSLCCCSYDRCNVGENPVYGFFSQLPSSGSNNGWGGSSGGGDSEK
uniref:Activin_recp domain-containing protein n=1 Tax=Angiostrongylus cantonensis TaxID=6313 RepID=A0A0K0DPA7_ANGCA